MREDDNMKKNDLISGKHIVELEDGDKYLFLEGRFVNSRFWYDTDAKICKIFEIQEAYSLSDMLVFDKGLNLIWENKELADVEISILKSINAKFKYIARDSNGKLFIYERKPHKYPTEWCQRDAIDFEAFRHMFAMIKWEDEEPTLIADLLEGSK